MKFLFPSLQNKEDLGDVASCSRDPVIVWMNKGDHGVCDEVVTGEDGITKIIVTCRNLAVLQYS